MLDYGTDYEKNTILTKNIVSVAQNISQENTHYPEDITQCAKGEMREKLGFLEEAQFDSGLSPLTRTEFAVLSLCDYDSLHRGFFSSLLSCL